MFVKEIKCLSQICFGSVGPKFHGPTPYGYHLYTTLSLNIPTKHIPLWILYIFIHTYIYIYKYMCVCVLCPKYTSICVYIYMRISYTYPLISATLGMSTRWSPIFGPPKSSPTDLAKAWSHHCKQQQWSASIAGKARWKSPKTWFIVVHSCY